MHFPWHFHMQSFQRLIQPRWWCTTRRAYYSQLTRRVKGLLLYLNIAIVRNLFACASLIQNESRLIGRIYVNEKLADSWISQSLLTTIQLFSKTNNCLCVINYVSGVEHSHEFLINNFINFFFIEHRNKRNEEIEDDEKKLSCCWRHVANTIFVFDSEEGRGKNNLVPNIYADERLTDVHTN